MRFNNIQVIICVIRHGTSSDELEGVLEQSSTACMPSMMSTTVRIRIREKTLAFLFFSMVLPTSYPYVPSVLKLPVLLVAMVTYR